MISSSGNVFQGSFLTH